MCEKWRASIKGCLNARRGSAEKVKKLSCKVAENSREFVKAITSIA